MQLERWCEANEHKLLPRSKRPRACTPQGKVPTQPDGPKPSPARPQLLIPLGSEAEVPSARAAIQFAYTGQIAARSIREALEVRCQGGYLQIHGCAAACDEFMKDQLKAAVHGNIAAVPATASKKDAVGRSSSVPESCPQQVFDLYNYKDLWPTDDAETDETSFAAVLTCAGSALVTHFHSALAVLNSPPLTHQLLALPPIALERLLYSNDFATDCESSVLLLLATWMAQNHASTDADGRKRLCRTIRLAQLSRPYASMLLPALAADYDAGPDKPSGWFALNFADALFTASIINAQDDERVKLLAMVASSDDEAVAAVYDCGMIGGATIQGSNNNQQQQPPPVMSGIPSSLALKLPRRQQCIPSSGLNVKWFISQQELLEAICRLRPGKTTKVSAMFEGGTDVYTAVGFHWSVWVKLFSGHKPFAGLFMRCELPPALVVPGSRLRSEAACRMVVRYNAELTVAHWRGGSREDIRCRSKTQLIERGSSRGWPSALPLKVQPQQKQQPQAPQVLNLQQRQAATAAAAGKSGSGGSGFGSGSSSDSASGGVDLLEAWAEYLRRERISGTLTLRWKIR